MQILLYLYSDGWRVADGWELPQYSYLSPARLGLGLSLAIIIQCILIATKSLSLCISSYTRSIPAIVNPYILLILISLVINT